MCPVERKVIEEWAKDAGIVEDEIKAAVDLEMRMRLAKAGGPQRKDLIVSKSSVLFFAHPLKYD